MAPEGQLRFENVKYRTWLEEYMRITASLRFTVRGSKEVGEHEDLEGVLVLDDWQPVHRIHLRLFRGSESVGAFASHPAVYEGTLAGGFMALLRWLRAILTDDVEFVKRHLEGHNYYEYMVARPAQQ